VTAELVSFSLVALSAVFFVVDPVGVVPVFLAMSEGDSEAKRRAMAGRACMIAAVVLTFFALGGSLVFRLLGISLAAFQIAGGLLLLLTALDMLRSAPPGLRTSGEEIAEGARKEDIAVVPLAMPLLAGPGAIATVVVLASRARHGWEALPIVGSVWLTCLVTWLVLRGAMVIDRALGRTGRAILERVMGLILAAIAVQFVIGGVRDALPEVFRT
jgi:multiple antibiotic resistance protein